MILGSLTAGCSDGDGPDIEARDLPAEAVVARSEADVDLRAGIATSEASVTAEAGGDGQVEEAVVVGDRALRRRPGEGWKPSGQSLVAITLPAFDQEGDDIALALRRIVLDATAPWIATTRDDTTTYTSDDPTAGRTLELEIDGQGHLIRIARSQPPAGTEADEARRVRAEVVFSDFDRTLVELPSDLPPE